MNEKSTRQPETLREGSLNTNQDPQSPKAIKEEPSTSDLFPPDESVPEIPADRRMMVMQPGWINFLDIKGSFSGCKLQQFVSVQEVNEFFTKHGGYTVHHMFPVRTGDGSDQIVVLYTLYLDKKQVTFMRERASFIEQHMKEWEQEQYAAEIQEEEQEAAAEVEKARLILLGAECEKNHKHNMKREKKK